MSDVPGMEHDTLFRIVKLLESGPREKKELAKLLSIEMDELERQLEELSLIDDTLLKQEDSLLTRHKTLDLLDSHSISTHLCDEFDLSTIQVSVFLTATSTNQLLRQEHFSPDKLIAYLAEHQSAGRGRRGKQWLSPFADNIYLSMQYRTTIPTAQIGLLSLAVGVALANLLQQFVPQQVYVKWPNDIYCEGSKLAGILIEAKEVTPNHADLIIGVGLNVYMQESAGIEQPWISLKQLANNFPARSVLAAKMLGRIFKELRLLESGTVGDFISRWQSFDYLRGRQVELTGSCNEAGIAMGINEQGELVVETSDGQRAIRSGEVSVRPV